MLPFQKHFPTEKSQPMLPTRLATAVALTALATLSVGAAPASASDTEPPTLTSPIKPTFVKGSQITPGGPDWGCNGEADGNGIVTADTVLKWSAYDDSGSVRYGLNEWTYSGGPRVLLTDSTATSYATQATTADQTCGGSNWTTDYFKLRAQDPAGNTTRDTIHNGGGMSVVQETGVAYGMHSYGPIPTIKHSAGWQTTSCTCYSGYSAFKTNVPGATATFRLNPTWGASHLAFVMSTGPRRGAFDVYVGGVLKKTVSTYARSSQDRIVTLDVAVKDRPNGPPPVRIVNRATAGHPWLYLDAVLTN
jgi:hypothetical protein